MIVKREHFIIMRILGQLPNDINENCTWCGESIYDTSEILVWVPGLALHPLCAKLLAERLVIDVETGGRYLGRSA